MSIALHRERYTLRSLTHNDTRLRECVSDTCIRAQYVRLLTVVMSVVMVTAVEPQLTNDDYFTLFVVAAEKRGCFKSHHEKSGRAMHPLITRTVPL